MNFLIIIESIKFYKLRHERTIQIWFVILYAINILSFVLPIGDPDLSKATALSEMLMAGEVAEVSFGDIFTTGNLIYFGMIALLSLINSFFTLMYASLYAGEADSLTPPQTLLKILAAVPRLLLMGLLLLVPAMLAAFLAFIPLIIIAMMMYFLPLNLVLNKQSLASAMRQSYNDTRHQKLFIFVQIFMLSILVSLPQSIIMNLFPSGGLPYIVLVTFFTVAQVFIQGRLMGILYLFIVKKVPFVVTSKPNDQK